jgi:serine/threonine protein kinase
LPAQQEEFAIKKIPFGGHGNQENIVMELEILRYSCHKNILFLTESYVYNSNVYIVTEYIDGLPLSRLCKIENLCLTEVTIASITKECLQGLEYLHERSCVHCDIKGSNILLSRDGKVRDIHLLHIENIQ